MILFLHNNSEYAKLAETQLSLRYPYISIGEKVTDFPEYDVGISFLYTYKIPKSQLHKTWYNFHPGPLPELGGRNLCYHAIMNNYEYFGATLHYIDENFDTGPIIECSRFCIDGLTAGEISEISCNLLLLLFNKYLYRLVNNPPEAMQKPLQKYYKAAKLKENIWITPEQEREIRALTTDKYCAKIKIGNTTYEVKPQ